MAKDCEVCLVAGSAECLHDDLAQARKIHPEAPIIAINGAARQVKAFALFSYHPDRFVIPGFDWIRHQRRLFGPDFTVHGARFMPDMPWVEFWWSRARGGGSSAWGARKVAHLMGFKRIVLCGCPLTPGPYVCHHGLGGTMSQTAVVEKYKREIMEDIAWHEGVYSMSGWSREFLGSC